MLRLHLPFFMHPKGWQGMIVEFLVILDATVALLTLGIVELNLSVAFYEEFDDEDPYNWWD